MLLIDKLQTYINYTAKNPVLLQTALTHKSYTKSKFANPDCRENNEKLEFIGDAVLDLVVADRLHRLFPQDNEGNLSRKRASIVNEDSLYNLAMILKIDECLLLGEGEDLQGMRYNKRLLASALEAIIGAIYLDQGYEAAHHWLSETFSHYMNEQFSEHDFLKDFKTRFQELAQEKWKATPVYDVRDVGGPDHQKRFYAQVKVKNEVMGEGFGESKKVAAQMAAEAALQRTQSVI